MKESLELLSQRGETFSPPERSDWHILNRSSVSFGSTAGASLQLTDLAELAHTVNAV